MGCDIHLHIEIKVNGKWEHYAAPKINRWYALFEKMAGVRGEVENAIILPRGVPSDINIVTLKSLESWDIDAHSVSWFSKVEIIKLNDWLNSLPGKNMLSHDLEYEILHTYCEGNSFCDPREPWIEDVRFVFWFDN